MAGGVKPCFKCGKTLPLGEFYRHPKMADGHVNKCKSCNKQDVRVNRKAKIDYYREYDRERGSRRTVDDLRDYRKRNPEKYKAHIAVNNAVRDGRLTKQPCSVCGSLDVHGHHEDYARPLDIMWLCAEHHHERHPK